MALTINSYSISSLTPKMVLGINSYSIFILFLFHFHHFEDWFQYFYFISSTICSILVYTCFTKFIDIRSYNIWIRKLYCLLCLINWLKVLTEFIYIYIFICYEIYIWDIRVFLYVPSNRFGQLYLFIHYIYLIIIVIKIYNNQIMHTFVIKNNFQRWN